MTGYFLQLFIFQFFISTENCFNRLYYLINDHDAGADEELRHVFKEIHYFLPHIDNVETYHRILRDNEQILNKNFEAACAECDHLLRFKARLRKNNMEDVCYISRKERGYRRILILVLQLLDIHELLHMISTSETFSTSIIDMSSGSWR